MDVVVLGSINLDIVSAVVELPSPGETLSARRVDRFPGGKGLNQAVAAARWGAVTAMVGAVGDDDAGRELVGVLAAAGVEVEAIARLSDAPTGHAFIFVSAAGENMIVVAGGANLALTPASLPSAGTARVFLSQLETPLDCVAAFLERARAVGGLTILNAAPAHREAAILFPAVDLLVVNETELARFAGLDGPPADLESVAAAARGLIARDGQRVVVTLGAAGAAAVGVEEVFLVPGRPAQVVDTTGAGDCFCGVLAAGLAAGADLAKAMAEANAAAACSTETPGAAVSMPTPSMVHGLIDRL